jgi:alpha-galactosidase
MQAYNYGMTLLRHLMDSILGPDIFVTQAISPLFPSQYAHARFNSTDVYSQLRDDQKGFPHWGSTEASLATGSHMGWVQGTILPYVNLDVTVMQRFEKNPELSEQEVKVRLYALMVMGSILGDGSDYRQPLAAQRARQFLDNPAVCAYFSHPRAFTPLRWADGDSEDQQMAFYLPAQAPADSALAAVFNFSNQQEYQQVFKLTALGLPPGKYAIRDFMTDQVVGTIADGQLEFTLHVAARDAQLVKVGK